MAVLGHVHGRRRVYINGSLVVDNNFLSLNRRDGDDDYLMLERVCGTLKEKFAFCLAFTLYFKSIAFHLFIFLAKSLSLYLGPSLPFL